MGQPEYEHPDEKQMQREIIEEIKLLDDKTLRLVHSMMRTHAQERKLEEDPIIDYEIDGTPVTRSQFLKEADAAVEDVRHNGGISPDELFEKAKQWLKDSQ